jgi:hypothetical protein
MSLYRPAKGKKSKHIYLDLEELPESFKLSGS